MSDDNRVPEWVLRPIGTLREIAGNNRQLLYLLGAAATVLYATDRLPDVSIPTWWPVALVAIGGAVLAGHWAAKRIINLIPDPEGILIVEFKASEEGGGAIYELSEEAFEQLRVVGGSLYQWSRSPRRVYEVREYDREHNVAVANWRETVPASELAEPPTVHDALAAIRELREDLEPDVAKARETRRRIRGIVRQLDKDRAEAQQRLLDDHVAPDLGDSRPISEIIDDSIPDELHPETVDVENAIENVESINEGDQRHDNGDSQDKDGEGTDVVPESVLWAAPAGDGA